MMRYAFLLFGDSEIVHHLGKCLWIVVTHQVKVCVLVVIALFQEEIFQVYDVGVCERLQKLQLSALVLIILLDLLHSKDFPSLQTLGFEDSPKCT